MEAWGSFKTAVSRGVVKGVANVIHVRNTMLQDRGGPISEVKKYIVYIIYQNIGGLAWTRMPRGFSFFADISMNEISTFFWFIK